MPITEIRMSGELGMTRAGFINMAISLARKLGAWFGEGCILAG
jgi:hypothetical protein